MNTGPKATKIDDEWYLSINDLINDANRTLRSKLIKDNPDLKPGLKIFKNALIAMRKNANEQEKEKAETISET